MEFVIATLAKEQKKIEIELRQSDLMRQSMTEAVKAMSRVSEIKLAIKFLKAKQQASFRKLN